MRSLGITGRHVTSYEGSRITIRPGFVNTVRISSFFPIQDLN